MDKSGFKNMWVHIEHDGENIHSVALEHCCEARKLCPKANMKR